MQDDDPLEALRLTVAIEQARAGAARGRARQAEAHVQMQQDAIAANRLEALNGFFEGLAMNKEMRRGELHDWLADRPNRTHPTHEEH